MSDLYEKMTAYCEVRCDVPLSSLTTLRIGGTARYVACPGSLVALDGLMRVITEEKAAWKIFGKGSNLLCSDDAYDGVIIKLDSGFTHSYFEGDLLTAEAGASIIALASEAMRHSLSGLEFACGIPGTLGGALFMNAGAYKASMADLTEEVLVYRDGRIEWVKGEDCHFGYRCSDFQKHSDWIILGARLRLKPGIQQEISALMADRKERRMNTQPLNYPSCGSVFRNPEGHFAWKLIDGIGYRGKRKGGVLVTEKHPNFIVNENEATAQDYIEMVEEIRALVKENFGVDLKTEMELFNWH